MSSQFCSLDPLHLYCCRRSLLPPTVSPFAFSCFWKASDKKMMMNFFEIQHHWLTWRHSRLSTSARTYCCVRSTTYESFLMTSCRTQKIQSNPSNQWTPRITYLEHVQYNPTCMVLLFLRVEEKRRKKWRSRTRRKRCGYSTICGKVSDERQREGVPTPAFHTRSQRYHHLSCVWLVMSATDKHNLLAGGSIAHVNFRVRGEKLGHGEEVFLVQQDDVAMRKVRWRWVLLRVSEFTSDWIVWNEFLISRSQNTYFFFIHSYRWFRCIQPQPPILGIIHYSQ